MHSSAKRKKRNDFMKSNPMHPILGVCDMAGCPRFCVFGEVCPGFCVFAKTQDAGRKTQKSPSPVMGCLSLGVSHESRLCCRSRFRATIQWFYILRNIWRTKTCDRNQIKTYYNNLRKEDENDKSC